MTVSVTALATARRARGGAVENKFLITRACRGSALPPLERLVLLTLADLADMDGAVPQEYSPSLTSLAKQTGLSRSVVADRLKKLESAGWVVRTAPSVADARSKRARTQYRITVPAVVSVVRDQEQTTSPGDGLVRDTDQSSSPPHGLAVVRDTDQSPAPTSPPHGHVPTRASSTKKLSTNPSTNRRGARDYESDPDFVRWYDTYPRKVGKPSALKAWNAAMKRDADPAEIIRTAERFREQCQRLRTEQQFIPHPSRWLNDERYADQPTLPSGGNGRTGPAAYRNDPNRDYSDWGAR